MVLSKLHLNVLTCSSPSITQDGWQDKNHGSHLTAFPSFPSIPAEKNQLPYLRHALQLWFWGERYMWYLSKYVQLSHCEWYSNLLAIYLYIVILKSCIRNQSHMVQTQDLLVTMVKELVWALHIVFKSRKYLKSIQHTNYSQHSALKDCITIGIAFTIDNWCLENGV